MTTEEQENQGSEQEPEELLEQEATAENADATVELDAAALNEALQQAKDQTLRTQAEMQNLRRRVGLCGSVGAKMLLSRLIH